MTETSNATMIHRMNSIHKNAIVFYRFLLFFIVFMLENHAGTGYILERVTQLDPKSTHTTEEKPSLKTLTVAQQKGGTGKTTTAHAIGSWLKDQGRRVLFVDLDAQTNLSFIMGARMDGLSVLDVLTGNAAAADAIQKTDGGNIIPGTALLAGADIDFAGKMYILSERLKAISRRFDYCIIDTPPALGALTVAALTAADSVIIPCLPDTLSIQALGQIVDTIKAVKKSCNPNLKIAGILLTRYTPRQKLTRDIETMLEQAAKSIGTRVFKARIRETVSIREAQTMGQSIYTYSANSAGAIDYTNLMKEIY